MPEPNTKKSTAPPAMLMVLGVVIMLIGVGRCGLLQPMIHGVNDDNGFGGACCLLIGIVTLIISLIWLVGRPRS